MWDLHLPTGETFRIRLFGLEGALLRFTGFHDSSASADYVLVAPESVVVTVQSVELDTFEGDYAPAAFEEADEEHDHGGG